MGTNLNSNPGSFPVFKAMPLGKWSDFNEKVNGIQMDFAAKSQALVHSLGTERKIHEAIKSDMSTLKARYDETVQANQRLEQSLQAALDRESREQSSESKYLKLIRERILSAAQSSYASYLQAFLSSKGVDESSVAFDAIELSLYISKRL